MPHKALGQFALGQFALGGEFVCQILNYGNTVSDAGEIWRFLCNHKRLVHGLKKLN